MRQPLHLFLAQPRASIQSAITRNRSIVLYKLNNVGQEREFSQSQKNTYKNNIRHGLFQQYFFSQASISFPFVIFFFNCSQVSNTLAWHSLVVVYDTGFFTLFLILLAHGSFLFLIRLSIDLIDCSLQRSPGVRFLAVSCSLFKITLQISSHCVISLFQIEWLL